MKFNSIVKLAGITILVACLATGCQNKKKKAEEEARARAEAEARARAEAEAAALAARVFEITPDALATASSEYYSNAQDYQAGLAAALKATSYGATEFALPGASFLFDVERCGLTPEHKALMKEFTNAWLASNRQSTILVEPYSADVKEKCYDNAIAVERGNRVEAYLKYLGVPAKKILVAVPACCSGAHHAEAHNCCSHNKNAEAHNCKDCDEECDECCCPPEVRAIEAKGAEKRCCRISIK